MRTGANHPKKTAYFYLDSGNAVNSFTMGKPVCFEAKLSSPKPGDRLYTNECFVTDTPDRKSTPKYTVIDNHG